MTKPTFYITTPIYYPSDTLHIGHCYTTVAADTMTRYKKMRGYDAYFLTGSDEHGQKIERSAAQAGTTPQDYVDEIVAGFKDLWQQYDIAYDDFIRTTEPRHEEIVKQIFRRLQEQGDIYKAKYEGYYCVPCETFFTERQLAEGHTCPDCGRPTERSQEESYFFKLGKYQDRLLQYIEEHPAFIQPVTRRNEMVNFIKQGLEELSTSRTTFSWGIPVPGDEKHVIYVWVDALTNYISALGYGTDDHARFDQYWPADVHLVGKDIVRFHTIIWPAILMALDLPLPKRVFAHGWILMDEGKMSKSKGNVVDPVALGQKYGTDAVRYFLLREFTFGLDGNYTEEILVNRINTDLANDYGNLLSRATAMIQKFQDGVILAPAEKTPYDDELLALFTSVPAEMADYMEKLEFHNALASIWRIVGKANKYIDETAPWQLYKTTEGRRQLPTVLYNMAEAMRFATIMLSPFLVRTPTKVWQQLGLTERAAAQTWDSLRYGQLPAGTVIQRGEPIFPRIEREDEEAKAAKAAKEAEKAARKAAKAAEKARREAEQAAIIKPQITIDDFAKIDLRVAEVLAAEKVANADKLLKLRIRIGEEERTLVAGVALHYAPEDLVGKHIVVVANLAPATLRGIESQGMLLAASDRDHLQVLTVDQVESGGRVK